jgi:hypothetical protein
VRDATTSLKPFEGGGNHGSEGVRLMANNNLWLSSVVATHRGRDE